MESLSKECFADQYNCKYPIYTKEAAEESYKAYCLDKNSILDCFKPEIEANFTKAASFHGIELQEPVIKEASVEMNLIAEEGAEDGVEMPVLRSMRDIEQAKDYILEKRASEPLKTLREGAKYVLWSAANSAMAINNPGIAKIATIAGVGVGSKDEILDQFDKRATLIELPVDQQTAFWAFSRGLHAISDEEFYKSANLNKIADTMDEIDRMYGLNSQYGKVVGGSKLMAPEEVCFGQTLDDLTKEASDMLHIKSIDTVISKKALLERKEGVNSFFEGYFGAEKLEDDAKMIEKVASLDENTAKALLNSLED
jgi:hypothetical protein